MSDEEVKQTDKPAMAQQPDTTQLPKPTQVEIQLAEILSLSKATRGEVGDVKQEVALVKGTVDLIQQDANLTKQEFRLRFVGIEGRVTELEGARVRHSERAGRVTMDNLEQDAKLANALSQLEEEKQRSARLEANSATKEDVTNAIAEANHAQTDAIVAGIKSAAKNPLVQKIGYALALLVLQAITVATAYLATKGH